MGPWTTLLVTYLIGGVTFIPLVVLLVLVHAHFTFPYRRDLVSAKNHVEHDIVQAGDDTSALDGARKKTKTDEHRPRAARDLDVAAGYFAVCREYTPMGLNARPIERSTPVGPTTVAAPSPSVYQTMYRSIFDRKSVAGPLDGANNSSSTSQRPKKAGNVFYVVLRHGHLMLFDDDEQLEVRHVISLAHHDISIYSGGDVTPEGELFIKRNALCLSRKQTNFDKQAPDSQTSKPFYLFSENCSAKEDFYFALLKSQEQNFGFASHPPIPKGFEVKNIISLVQRLHASEDHVHSRWLNALLGRIFLAVYRTHDLENSIREKITKKISRVKRPSFLANITIQNIDTGETAPFFTNLKLKDLTVEGECVIGADVRYTGNFRIEVGATAKLDLGTRFKAREVALLLAVVLKRIEGHVLFKIKAPPSNRIWMSFQTMPKMEMAIEPIVSSRQITYTLILRQIENRIKEVFAETLVQPFWDDVPFFKTEHKIWRGGIFQDDDAVESSEPSRTMTPHVDLESLVKQDEPRDLLKDTRPIEKSHTLPILEEQPAAAATGLFGRKLGKNANGSATSVLSTGIKSRSASSANNTASPSLNIVKSSMDPVVGTETTHADLFKPSSPSSDHATNLMASIASRSREPSPMHTPFGSPAKASSIAKMSRRSSASSKEVAEKEKGHELETTPIPNGRRSTTSSAESLAHSEDSNIWSSSLPAAGSSQNQIGAVGRGFFARRDAENTLASSDPSTGGEMRKTTLAAVTSVAEQARQWGWNAIRRQRQQREQRRNNEKSHPIDISQPMGRGQPLPPPGTPLPGPNDGVSRFGTTMNTRRKPVAAPAHQEEQILGDIQDADKDFRSSKPRPLTQRRRRGGSQQQEEGVAQCVLVVAAPDDSEPGTPATESETNLDEAWAEATREETLTESNFKPEQVHTMEIVSDKLEEAGSGTVSGASGLSSETTRQETQESLALHIKMTKESPLVALPADVADIDDDDFSGWMDNDDIGDDPDLDPISISGSVAIK